MSENSYKAAADFGLALFKYYRESSRSTNCVISPVSVFLCLSALKQGAKGATKEELEKALSGSGNDAQDIMKIIKDSLDEVFLLTTANGLFLQEGIEPLADFVSDLQNVFEAKVQVVNLNSREGVNKVNDWAANETNGKIKEVLGCTNEETFMALVNAVYMKGTWEHCFHEKPAEKGNFKVSTFKKVKVDLMTQTDHFLYYRDKKSNFALAFFPYAAKCGNSGWEMGILMPDKGSNLASFLQFLEYDSLRQIRARASLQRLHVILPKFRVEESIDLYPIMERIGVNLAFTREADFSGISETAAVKVSSMLQKCYVDVDEDGTEAAAVTFSRMVAVCCVMYRSKPIKFHVKSPFVFFIYHATTGITLFCGCVADPTA